MNKDLLIFEELAEKSLIVFENNHHFKMTLALTILYMGSIKAAKGMKHSVLRSFMTSVDYPPNRYILAYVILRNMSGHLAEFDEVFNAILRRRDIREDRVRKLIKIAERDGILIAKKGIINPHKNEIDKRRKGYLFVAKHIPTWLSFLFEHTGMNAHLNHESAHGAWDYDEHMALMENVGYISSNFASNDWVSDMNHYMNDDATKVQNKLVAIK